MAKGKKNSHSSKHSISNTNTNTGSGNSGIYTANQNSGGEGIINNTTNNSSLSTSTHSSTNTNTFSSDSQPYAAGQKSVSPNHKHKQSSSVSDVGNTNYDASPRHITQSTSLYQWIFVDKYGFYCLLFFMVCGYIAGYISGHIQNQVQQLQFNIHGTDLWDDNHNQYSFIVRLLLSPGFYLAQYTHTSYTYNRRYISDILANMQQHNEIPSYMNDPTNLRTFAILREAIVREKGGFVHPDLGILYPAPCGSIRGLGMIRSRHYNCQRNCFPSSTAINVTRKVKGQQLSDTNMTQTPLYRQEEILMRVPLKFQITRNVASVLFDSIIPPEVQQQTNMQNLDDAMYLTLFLAHERGVGIYSKWFPYIISLPQEPTCGYSRRLRPHMLNAIEAYRIEIGVDTDGWAIELYKAMIYAERIVESMNTNYGTYIKTPPDVSSIENLRWALCQVASRGIAASIDHGSLRLIPMVDLMNHDADAGSFVELTGKERVDNGDILNALSEDDSGTIIVRSVRHGQHQPLRRGQELLVNYNIPYYTPLDWFVSMGFVPPERSGPWIKIDAVLPPIRRDGPFAYANIDPEEHFRLKEEKLIQHLKDAGAY